MGVQDALQDARHRLDLVLSGSQANIDENLSQIPLFARGDVPARAIPYGVALDGGWDMPRAAALERVRDLERHLSRGPARGRVGCGGATEGQRPFVITYFSRIDVEKGPDLALHALSVLRQQGVSARLWIAGNAMPGSAYLEVLRQKIRLLDLTDRVSSDRHPARAAGQDRSCLRASDAFAAGVHPLRALRAGADRGIRHGAARRSSPPPARRRS